MPTPITDDELLRRFRDRSITRLEWTHTVHVRLAYLALTTDPYDAALDHVRRGILALNESFGARSSPDGGYHETLTCAWMQLVADAMHTPRSEGADTTHHADSQAFLDANPQLAHKEAIHRYYSPERLATVQARTSFIEPDIAPLPPLHHRR